MLLWGLETMCSLGKHISGKSRVRYLLANPQSACSPQMFGKFGLRTKALPNCGYHSSALIEEQPMGCHDDPMYAHFSELLEMFAQHPNGFPVNNTDA